jgi:hypothetical protein
MAALLTAADAKLLRVNGTEEPVQQEIVNTLYAIAVLAHMGVSVEEDLVLRLAEAALRYQLEDEACLQVRPELLVARREMHVLGRWGRLRATVPTGQCCVS